MEFNILEGKVLTSVKGKIGDEALDFVTHNGGTYRLYYVED